MLSFAILLLMWVIDGIGGVFGGSAAAIATYVAVFTHFSDMTRGIIDSKDIVYFLSVIVGALFLTVLSVESRRWR